MSKYLDYKGDKIETDNISDNQWILTITSI